MKILISNTSENPLYQQIKDQIKDAILKEELVEGDPLPSIRAFANDLSVSVLTIRRVYEELEKEGFVTSYEEAAEGRTRKYYRLTEAGKGELAKQTERWNAYAAAVHKVLNGGACCAGI